VVKTIDIVIADVYLNGYTVMYVLSETLKETYRERNWRLVP